MPDLYPIFFSPVYKHYMWGGRNLSKLGRDLPNGKQVAESWEISSHADGMTVINNGQYAGKTLPELLNFLGEELVGRNNQWALDRGIFPLMVKLLDAEQRLSVQVHPDDEYAYKHEGQSELGKAEMWVVLRAEPNAAVIYGFSKETSPDDLRQAINTGTLEPFLHKIPIRSGDHICVPPGTLHAILEGAMMIEIQQNSNTTYRVYDWNRTDKDGNRRDLHVENALAVINFQQINSQLPTPTIVEDTPHITREQLCHNAYFTTERITVKRRSAWTGCCDGSSLEIWGVINGQAQIADEMVEGINFCLLPAGLGRFSIQADANSILLRVYTG